jgi:NAD(P)-dependent dehydrogenase (short-subunit alcohol dehydrogenase family)
MSQRVQTPFTRTSTASEVIDDVDLTGKTAIVTGAGSGLGIETARALASAGAEVTLAVRRPQAAAGIAAGIVRETGNTAVSVTALDLADQDSVLAFTTAWNRPLHILVNNAGIMALPELERTREGWEMQFATNFMGHFALTVGLHGPLAAANGARIVSLSSSGNLFSPVVFDDLHFDFRPYDPLVAYCQSKTADALLAVEATRRWSGEGIYANALNPGAIATGLQKHTGDLKTPKDLQRTIPQGAATSVLLAASPLLDKVGGRYFEDCNEAATVTRRPADYAGVAWYALDPANAERLWDTALGLLPVSVPA